MFLKDRLLIITLVAAVFVCVTILVTVFKATEDNGGPYSAASLVGAKSVWTSVMSNHHTWLTQIANQMRYNAEIIEMIKNDNKLRLSEALNQTQKQLDDENHYTQLYILGLNKQLLYPKSEQTIKTFDSINEGASIVKSQNNELLYAYKKPLLANNKNIGSLLFITKLKILMNAFSAFTNSEAFLVLPDGVAKEATNQNLFIELAIKTPEISKSESYVKDIGDRKINITVQSLKNIKNNPIIHLVSAQDISETLPESGRSFKYVTFVTIFCVIIAGVVVVFTAMLDNKKQKKTTNQLVDALHLIRDGNYNVLTNEMTGSEDAMRIADAISGLAESTKKNVEHADSKITSMSSVLEDIRGKSEFIQDVIGLASQGDLSGEMMVFSGGETIDQVANGIAIMLESLNELIGKVKQSGIQVTSSATEIAATAKEQEATVTEQAATVNEIMSTVKDISTTSKQLVETMHEVAEVAESTATNATESQSSLMTMEKSMHQMMDATESIGSKLSVISEKAGNINTVVTTITKVADQTNLLSLNAAIEAEKAGEYGAGFSVVATEIRRLADQTAVATWDIEQMVKEMQSAVSSGVMGMDKFSDEVRSGVANVAQVGSQIADIIERVQTLIPRFDIVHEGMQSQSLSAEQISESMVQLNESAQQTADSLRHSNDAIMQLNDAAQILQEAVSKFRLKS